MLEVADIFRLHGPAYQAKISARILPSHLRAMQDIEQCRTASLGGQLYYCAQCDQQRYSYHSCKNRHCPKCQNEQANEWLQEQKDLLLPIQHFLVTFTLPAELRALARSHQKTIYNLLFRAKFRDQLKNSELFAAVAPHVWRRDWVVHSEAVGSGEQAFKYLAPYIFRVAISNNRLRKLHDGQVTFTYKQSATDQLKRCTTTAEEFIRRFLQHVLPGSFIKVRYYGLLSPAHRQLLLQARQLLSVTTSKLKTADVKTTEPLALLSCPHCGGPLTLLTPLAPRGRAP
jgi:hypothetical protein